MALRRAPGPRARWLWAGAGVLAALALLGNSGVRSMVSSWWTLRGLRKDLSAARKEEDLLKGRIAAAKGDDRALERAARTELGLQRPGEIEYRFPPPERR
ncbi:MAG: septum formation initiator family protein [Elusimicrobia bacterium]|nr:septum formation initiator family protein [Elusimicrobiota bacterium]